MSTGGKQVAPVEFQNALKGQKRALTMLSNMVRYEKLHHALFFYGLPTVGKTTAALNLAKALSCQSYQRTASESSHHKKTKQLEIDETVTGKTSIRPLIRSLGYCNHCQSCRAINFYKSDRVLLFSLDNRLPVIRFLQGLLIRFSKRTPPSPMIHQSFIQAFISECYLLIARHKQSMLTLLKRKKVSYPEGIVIDEKQLEKRLYDLYNALNVFHETGSSAQFLEEAMIEDLTVLQNSLDRTYLAKESLDRIFSWAQQPLATVNPVMQSKRTAAEEVSASSDRNLAAFNNEKIVIIKGIEYIHPLALGKFLKILEDPFPHTRFIIITDKLEALAGMTLTPLLSRCFKIPFAELTAHWTGVILRENFGIESSRPYKNLATFIRSEGASAWVRSAGDDVKIPPHANHVTNVKSKASEVEALKSADNDANMRYQNLSESKANASKHDVTLIVALLQAWKRPLSYLHYLAKERHDEMEGLLKDLKALLALYLEAKFIKGLAEENSSNPAASPSSTTEESKNLSSTNSGVIAPSPSNPPSQYSQLEQKLIAMLEARAYSYKKIYDFSVVIQRCEYLREIGVISNEAILNRLALFIRKIY
ncbi:hypothetical protein COTS27_00078 [Spirochaetota bacterium]|nr:hypothetical protein COTS27_00078 [Spirochaetota bacterium]